MLKLSGEALLGEREHGISTKTCDAIAREIKDIDCCLDGDSILMEYSNPVWGYFKSDWLRSAGGDKDHIHSARGSQAVLYG